MSSSDTNPKPGLPLPDAMAGNFQDAMRWFQQMWAGGAAPGAGAMASGIPSMMMPTMDVKELEKRISDLRSVEHWLQVNQGLLRSTIQALEMQRDTLVAWQTIGAGRAAAAGPTAATSPAGTGEMPGFQPAMWWNALQQQFAQMAAAAQAPQAPADGATPAPAAKAATAKTKPGTGSKG